MPFKPCDLRQTAEYADYMQSIGWKVEQYSNGQAFIRSVPILGSVIKIQHPQLPISYDEINQIAKKYKAIFVKLEPYSEINSQLSLELKENGFIMDSFPLLPSKTLILNLLPTENELFTDLEKDTRNAIRRTQKDTLLIQNSDHNPDTVTIETFVKMWQDNARRKNFAGASNNEISGFFNSFSKQHHAQLIFISKENEILAGSLILYNQETETAHYLHAFSTEKGRKMYAPYRLVWESILYSKNTFRAKHFDMEGIYDERYPKSTSRWKGFSHFKKGFKGTEKTYIGSFTKYYNPLFKLLSFLE